MPKIVFTIEGEAGQSFSKAGKEASRSFEKAFKQTGQGTSETQEQTQAVKNQEEALKDLRKELRRKISLVDADLRLGNKSQEEAEQSIKKIKQWAEAQDAFNRSHLVGAQNLKTFANAQNRAKNDFRGMSAVTNRANQVLFDFNQGLQDLPFGMRGVGNNIPFVINGFQRFAKAAREDGISPIKGFMAALTSPAGLIGTAAAVIPTLILFAQQFDLFGNSAKEAKKQVGNVIGEIESLQSTINDFRGLESLFGVEGDLETARTLAVFEEDIKDRIKSLEEQFTITAIGGATGIVDEDALNRITRLEALLEETEKRRLEIEEKVAIAKEAQTTDAIKQIESEKQYLELLDKANKLEEEVNKKNKEALEFQIEENEIVGRGNEQREKELKADTERRAKRLAEEAKMQQKLIELRRTFARDEQRFQLKVTQQRLAREHMFIERRTTLEQQLANELSTIRNNSTLDELERERAIFEARKKFMQRTLQLEQQVAQQRKQIDQELSQSRIQLQQLTLNALTSLSQAVAKDNKAVAIGILAIEKGLAIAQAAKEGAEKAGRAQMIASYYQAQAFTPLGPNPAAIAAAANAQAQVAAIKGTTAATIAAIAATGLGEAASIALRGGRTTGTGAGGRTAAPEGFQTTEIERSPTNFAQSGQQAPINIELQTEADSKIIRKKSVQGKKEIESNVTVSLGSD